MSEDKRLPFGKKFNMLDAVIDLSLKPVDGRSGANFKQAFQSERAPGVRRSA